MRQTKLLTLDDLVDFWLKNGMTNFSSKESGYDLRVQVLCENFEIEQEEKDDLMLYANIRLMHTGRNRNQSNLTEKAAKKCLSKIAYKPILADFTDINGERDFTYHTMEQNEDGTTNYIEKQVGCFTSDKAYIKEDSKNKDRQYIYARAAIPRQYTDAAEIIERKGGTKVSAELAVNEISYSIEDGLLLEDVEVMGCTLLGTDPDTGEPVMEGMENAFLQIEDFSAENNSIINYSQFINSIADAVVQRLSDKAEFSAKNLEEGGESLNKFEELLNMYEKTVEDITFEYENLSDEELEEAFKNAFAVSESEDDSEGDAPSEDDETPKEPESEEAFADDDPVPGDDELDDESDDESDDEPENEEHQSVSTLEDEESGTIKVNNSIEYSVNIDGKIKQFSVSLGEKINAISTLVNDTYSESDNTWYFCDVYEEPSKYVVMHDFWFDRHFRQEYSVKKDVYSLKGDRIQVFTQYLTSDEISQLESMKSNYSAIESELNEYKSKELHSKRENVLSSESYFILKNDKDFKELVKNMDNYSVEDLSKEADLIFAKYMKSHNTFSAKKNPYGIVNMNTDSTEKDEKLPYGGLFKDFKKK